LKTKAILIILFFLGIFILPGCNKTQDVLNIPISLTDKSGSFFIKIDTTSKSFTAYSPIRITQGQLTGVFSDTVRSNFQLAIAAPATWDSLYHPADTVIFAPHFTGHTIVVNAPVDLSRFNPPYHFIFIVSSQKEMEFGAFGKPSIQVTFTSNN
jgi:hypothetical protein